MAIQVGGTTVISNNQQLTSVNGLKTINGASILGSGDIAVGGGFPWNDKANLGNGTTASIANNTNNYATVVSGGNNNGRYFVGTAFGFVTNIWTLNMNAGNGGGEGWWFITTAKYTSNDSSGEFNANVVFGTPNVDTDCSFVGNLQNNTRAGKIHFFGFVPSGGEIRGYRKTGNVQYWEA